MKVIPGTSNKPLAAEIARLLRAGLIEPDISKFPNGESRVYIPHHLKHQAAVIVQTCSPPVDEHIIETLLLADAARRLGSPRIYLVIPWMGYSLQNRIFQEGEPLSARLIAGLLSATPARNIILTDIHDDRILKFFGKKAIHISAKHLLLSHIRKHIPLKNCVLVYPDAGSAVRWGDMASSLHLPAVSVGKVRHRTDGTVHADTLSGSVSGKNAIIVDDGIITGSTIETALRLLDKNGARDIHFYTTHLVLPPSSYGKRILPRLTSFVCTDTFEQQPLRGITTVSIAPVIAKTIRSLESR